MNLYSGLTYWGQNIDSYALNCQTLAGEVKDLLWSLFEQCSHCSCLSLLIRLMCNHWPFYQGLFRLGREEFYEISELFWMDFLQSNQTLDLIIERVLIHLKVPLSQKVDKNTIMFLSYQLTNSICSWLILVLFLCVLSQDSPNDWSQLGISYLSPSEASMTWEINI